MTDGTLRISGDGLGYICTKKRSQTVVMLDSPTAVRLEVSVAGQASLLSAGLADGTVRVENQFPKWLPLVDLVDPLAKRFISAGPY